MGIFKSIKDVMVTQVEVPDTKVSKKEEEKPTIPLLSELPPINPGKGIILNPTISPTTTETLNQEIIKDLIETVNKATPGDYSQFIGFLESLTSIIPDEKICYQAALKSASKVSPSININTLTKCGEIRLTALENERISFENSIENDSKDNLDLKKNEIALIDSKIIELEKAIETHKQLKIEKEKELEKQILEIERVKFDFKQAYKYCKLEIENITKKINSYLNN